MNIKRYIAAYIIYLTRLDIQNQNWAIAAKLIADNRTKVLPMKRTIQVVRLFIQKSITPIRRQLSDDQPTQLTSLEQ